MIVGTPEEEKKLAELDLALADANKKFDAIVPLLEAAQQQWEADMVNYDVTLPELAPDSKAGPADKKLAEQVTELLKKEASARNANEKQQLQSYFRGKATKLYQAERDRFAEAQNQRKDFYESLPKCLVSVSGANKRTVRILPRGNWMDETGEVMKPALPHYLPQAKVEGRDLTRLDLAQWLVARDNPLTARTVMNRMWKQLFGSGLEQDTRRSGGPRRAARESHLLDWLACEFMDSQWDVKHMVRTIVNSAAYKQVSHADGRNAGRRSLEPRIRAAKRPAN